MRGFLAIERASSATTALASVVENPAECNASAYELHFEQQIQLLYALIYIRNVRLKNHDARMVVVVVCVNWGGDNLSAIQLNLFCTMIMLILFSLCRCTQLDGVDLGECFEMPLWTPRGVGHTAEREPFKIGGLHREISESREIPGGSRATAKRGNQNQHGKAGCLLLRTDPTSEGVSSCFHTHLLER